MTTSFQHIDGGVCAPQKFLASAVSCGIKNPTADRLDMALITSELPCVSAGTFTTNKVKAAPVRVSQSNLRSNSIQAIIANSGNANCCTGTVGMADAKTMCKDIAKLLKLTPKQIGVCSTGVIGLPMPMSRVTPKFDELVNDLSPNKGHDVARAIMTSDTRPKEIAITFEIGGKQVRIGACAKGAGMISPAMATMLCFITTDMKIAQEDLQKATLEAVEHSFNRITIDGDMSTNDTVLVLANGAAGNKLSKTNNKEFADALNYVMLKMAQSLVSDGERVTKFVTVKIKGARHHADAKKAAEAVAKSALVKSSWNGNDPNWGRIIHAVGYSRARMLEEHTDIYIDEHVICKGGLQADTPMDLLREVVANPAFTVTIDLNLGSAEYEMYTSDLSPEYIDFNRSEYAYWKQARKDGLV